MEKQNNWIPKPFQAIFEFCLENPPKIKDIGLTPFAEADLAVLLAM